MKKIKIKIKKIDFKVAFILKLETFCKWGSIAPLMPAKFGSDMRS